MMTSPSTVYAQVWYACYGSNMCRDRFMAYLAGGRPAGATRTYPGCSDPTAPAQAVALRWPGRVYFAIRSAVWAGGVAFADVPDPAAGSRPEVLGRGYLISARQFCELVHFENNGTRAADAADLPLADVVTAGRLGIGPGAYETLWCIGDRDGVPVITFTAPFGVDTAHRGDQYLGDGAGKHRIRTCAPSAAYASTIGRGLGETFGLSVPEQADYIRACPGGDAWDQADLVAALAGRFTRCGSRR